MNPIAAAGGWGLIKGLVAGKSSLQNRKHFASYVTGPITEEAMFRLPQLHPALSSAAFAAVHLSPAMVKGNPVFSLYRFAEVFAGGWLYDKAFKQYGFLGAVGAHVGHNLMCTLGGLLSPRSGYSACPAHFTGGSGPRSPRSPRSPRKPHHRVVCHSGSRNTRLLGRIRR
jgi:membrane protease YdiL (CAAX protease family)